MNIKNSDIITKINKLARKSVRFQSVIKICYEIFWIEKIMLFKFNVANNNCVLDDVKFNSREIDFRFAREDDVEKMAIENNYNITIKGIPYYKSFTLNNNFMILAEAKFQIVAYAACILKNKKMGNLYFKIYSDECFVLACFTKFEYRGLGLCPACIQNILNECLKRNINIIYIDIATSNDSSIKSALKAGAKDCFSGYYRLRFLKKDYVFPYGKLKSRFIKCD